MVSGIGMSSVLIVHQDGTDDAVSKGRSPIHTLSPFVGYFILPHYFRFEERNLRTYQLTAEFTAIIGGALSAPTHPSQIGRAASSFLTGQYVHAPRPAP